MILSIWYKWGTEEQDDTWSRRVWVSTPSDRDMQRWRILQEWVGPTRKVSGQYPHYPFTHQWYWNRTSPKQCLTVNGPLLKNVVVNVPTEWASRLFLGDISRNDETQWTIRIQSTFVTRSTLLVKDKEIIDSIKTNLKEMKEKKKKTVNQYISTELIRSTIIYNEENSFMYINWQIVLAKES